MTLNESKSIQWKAKFVVNVKSYYQRITLFISLKKVETNGDTLLIVNLVKSKMLKNITEIIKKNVLIPLENGK